MAYLPGHLLSRPRRNPLPLSNLLEHAAASRLRVGRSIRKIICRTIYARHFRPGYRR